MNLHVPASSFIRSIEDVAPFAADDGSLPMLNAVHFEVGPKYLTVMSTDRYALARSRSYPIPNLTAPEPQRWAIRLADARTLVRNYKPKRADTKEVMLSLSVTGDQDGTRTLTTTPEGDPVTDGSALIRVTCALLSVNFPSASQIIDTPTEPTALIGVNPRYVTAAARRQRARNEPMTMTFGGTNKPMRINMGHPESGDEFEVLIMPVRQSDASGRWTE